MAQAPGGGASGGGGGSGAAGDARSAAAGGSYEWQSACLDVEGTAQVFPAAENNKAPILEVLRRRLPPGPGLVLEVASGTGQHVSHFARALPALTWQPSDLGADLFPSIAAHCRGLANVRAPVVLDASWPPARWEAAVLGQSGGGGGDVQQQQQQQQQQAVGAGASPGGAAAPPVVGVVVANLTHIAPWAATEGLVAGAAALLRAGRRAGARGGALCIYGPFKLRGAFTTESNEAFHQRLVASNPEWGYRDTDEIEALARANGLHLVSIEPMPANNFDLIFGLQEGEGEEKGAGGG